MWIYKKKRGVDGKVETYKTRFITKGYSPKLGFKSNKILLSIATHFDCETWQIEVKTTFLNGNLDENIYMTQPDGFIAKG